jgi:acetyl-CoA carboxylase biotin carboxyl carrier protein
MEEIKASMAGSIWKINVDIEEEVEAGQDVVVLESMKMEIPITTEKSGIIKALKMAEGDFVNAGDVILVIEER